MKAVGENEKFKVKSPSLKKQVLIFSSIRENKLQNVSTIKKKPHWLSTCKQQAGYRTKYCI